MMDPTEPHILVVDDDIRLRGLLNRFLSENGFRVTEAEDAADARARLAALAFDALILDVMMPGETGLELVAALRQAANTRNTPILMLTALGESEARIAGLEKGADDYLAKPFEPRELLLRLKSILRRGSQGDATGDGPRMIRLGACLFDMEREELMRDGKPVKLSPSDLRLLSSLARRRGETISREELSGEGEAGVNARNVDVQVTRLRRRIEEDPRMPRYLKTVRGVGYVLTPDM